MGIKATHVGKQIGHPAVRILNDISLDIRDGEFVSLTGRSGSGKSTLLYLLSTLDSPTEGTIEISGQDISKMQLEELYRFRNQSMGFVFQFNYLIAELTAIENVLMPTRKFKQEIARRSAAESLLERCGLKDKLQRRPRELSGGEQQRVAVARSLVMEPRYLFADEPTGSLDTVNGDMVMNIIIDVNRNKNTSVILVTHDPDFAAEATRSIKLVDGMITQAEILSL